MEPPNPQLQKQTPPIQYILLDSNIIHYSADKNSYVAFTSYLSELAQRGFGLAISEITLYELLRGTYVKKKSDMINVLNLFPRYFITNQALTAAADLETLYNIDKIPTSVEDGDKFIGATSILTASLILTANSRDYPLPFFAELERRILSYNYNNRLKSIPVSLLSPDMNIINMKFNEIPNQ